MPQTAVGVPGVLHLISEDIYIDIMVTSWNSGLVEIGGGFSYVRAQAPIPEPSTGLLLALGLTGFLLPGHHRKAKRLDGKPHTSSDTE